MGGWVRGIALATGGSAAVAAVGLFRSVLIARLMGPGAFGIWQFCLVALRFAPESHAGVLHAQALDVPGARVEGRDAATTERAALGVSVAHAAVAGAVAAVLLRVLGGPGLGPAAALLGCAVVAWQWFHAEAILHRSRGGFGRLAVLQCAFAGVHVAALAMLLPDRYVSGALLAWIVAVIAAVAAARAVSRESVPWPALPGPGLWAAMVHRGLPAYLVDLGAVALMNVDRIVVGAFLGSRALGHYGVLAVGGAAVLLVPDVLGRVLWPAAGEALARAGGDGAALAPMATRAIRCLAAVVACATLAAAQGTEVLVAWLLPVFEPALPALRWYLAATFLLSLCVPLRILLVTAGEGRAVLRAQGGVMLVALVTQVAVAWGAGSPDPGGVAAASPGIAAVAAVAAAAAACLGALLLAFASRRLGLGATARRLGAECALLLGAAFALDAAIGALGGDPATGRGAALRLGLPAVLGFGVLGVLLLRARRGAMAAADTL